MRRVLKSLVVVVLTFVILISGGIGYYRWKNPPPPPPPTQAELAALEAKRAALQERVLDLTVRKDRQGLDQAPRGSIMIGVPTSFTRSIVEQVVTGLFSETTLTLRNLKVHKDGEVKVKALIKKRKVGEYVLDVDIHEVQGLLRPGKPELTFGQNRIGVKLPVGLAEGTGTAAIRLAWDSKGLAANTVCGDVDVTKEVSGGVVPAEYAVDGVFGIAAAGESVVLTPDFGELAVLLQLEASEAAWKAVDEVIEEQRGACKATLRKIDIKSILAKLIGKGFNVKIPSKIFKPVKLPAGVKSSLKMQGVDLALHVKPTGLAITNDRIWYGADLTAASGPAAAAAAKKPAAPKKAPAKKPAAPVKPPAPAKPTPAPKPAH